MRETSKEVDVGARRILLRYCIHKTAVPVCEPSTRQMLSRDSHIPHLQKNIRRHRRNGAYLLTRASTAYRTFGSRMAVCEQGSQ